VSAVNLPATLVVIACSTLVACEDDPEPEPVSQTPDPAPSCTDEELQPIVETVSRTSGVRYVDPPLPSVSVVDEADGALEAFSFLAVTEEELWLDGTIVPFEELATMLESRITRIREAASDTARMPLNIAIQSLTSGSRTNLVLTALPEGVDTRLVVQITSEQDTRPEPSAELAGRIEAARAETDRQARVDVLAALLVETSGGCEATGAFAPLIDPHPAEVPSSARNHPLSGRMLDALRVCGCQRLDRDAFLAVLRSADPPSDGQLQYLAFERAHVPGSAPTFGPRSNARNLASLLTTLEQPRRVFLLHPVEAATGTILR